MEWLREVYRMAMGQDPPAGYVVRSISLTDHTSVKPLLSGRIVTEQALVEATLVNLDEGREVVERVVR